MLFGRLAQSPVKPLLAALKSDVVKAPPNDPVPVQRVPSGFGVEIVKDPVKLPF